MRQSPTWIWMAVVVMAAGCGGAPKPEPTPKPGGLAAAMVDTAADTETMRQAQAAANEVIRNADDCALVKPAAEEALAKFEQARGKVKTGAALATLDALQVQVKNIASACP